RQRPQVMRVHHLQQRLGEFRVVVLDLLVGARAEQRERLDQALDVRVLAAIARQQQAPGDLRVALGELLAITTQEAELALVVGQQVFHFRCSSSGHAATARRRRLTEYCNVLGCSIASKLTGSRAGCTSSRAWIEKCNPPTPRSLPSRPTRTLCSRDSWRAIACS